MLYRSLWYIIKILLTGGNFSYQQDINKANPHGTSGKIAVSFSDILQCLCTCNRTMDLATRLASLKVHTGFIGIWYLHHAYSNLEIWVYVNNSFLATVVTVYIGSQVCRTCTYKIYNSLYSSRKLSKEKLSWIGRWKWSVQK